MKNRTWIAISALVWWGCGGGGGTPANDAGVRSDAYVVRTDSGPARDSGPAHDSGPTTNHDGGPATPLDGGGGDEDDGGGSTTDGGTLTFEGAYATYSSGDHAFSEAYCPCVYEISGYDSVEDCVASADLALNDCTRDGFEAIGAEVAAYLDCQGRGAQAAAACWAANTECDLGNETFNTCLDEIEPCSPLSEEAGAAFQGPYTTCAETELVGAAGTCPVGEVVTTLGSAVFSGTTIGAGDDTAGSCGGAGAPERAFRWRATEAGDYVFDTLGSLLDTVLYVRSTCESASDLDCNDDLDTDAGNYRSQLTLTLEAAQEVVVVVDGYSSDTVVAAGPFVVNINRVEP